MPKMTTIKEVAQFLKVSPSTISKALSDSPEISQSTKQRVRETAEALSYVPNHYARSLKSKTTRTIGIMVPNVIDDFFAKVLHGIEKEASKYGFTLLVTFSNDRKKDEYKNLLSLINHSVDGILISFSKETQKSNDYSSIRNILNYGLPMVMFDRIHGELPIDSVTIDDFNGALIATEYLHRSGCKKIAFLSPIANTSVGRSRKAGYLSALKSMGPKSNTSFSIEFSDYAKFKKTFSGAMAKHGFDGILAADELSAVYALNTLQQLGHKVPKKASVIGFTNGPMAQASHPALSVVSQHAERIGRMSLRLIRDILINPQRENKRIVIRPELVLRDSTKKMKQK
ncbi:LacI family DNA-binding transcriptional regulator [Flagellimonas flava]|uniref:LacI family transcriptional regulator n=1 Tax=Flagellimonas flava TaxID=570519 RepID=A0A1M5NMH2_9FLAO|nr:LacI family DNA-binding transcriptional regulator [Allomuricauda flava]SHG90667.1 LacI family transcriptional regulator [Allomuricauda flava]